MRIGNNKGMTLVELLVAIALLGIIAVSMLGIFSTSIATIFNFGRNSKATMQDNSLMDKVYKNCETGSYSLKSDVQTMIANVLVGEGYSSAQYKLASSLSSLSTREGTEQIRYYVSDEINQSGIAGFSVNISIFHSDYKQHATLTTFVVKGGL